jgi:imidazoleglycerol-phosphate dehydratase
LAKRKATIERKTKETDITLSLNLDGTGKVSADTGVGFLDHMLDHLGRHGRLDLTVKASGDLHVDDHHTVEDVGICLGEALIDALGDKKGITRFGSASVPMDESLADVAVDLSGRAACVCQVPFTGPKIGTFDVELLEEFLRAFAGSGKFNLHVRVPYGTNNHHMAEAAFKALARALADAVRVDPTVKDVPSTKGTL